MRALVTGGAGFIGSSIARALLERGDDVRVVDSLVTGFRENVPEGTEFVLGDLRDPEVAGRVCTGVEVVFHEAAIRSVPKSVDDPSAANDNNVTATLNLLLGAEAAGVSRLVYASSSSVYGGAEDGLNREDAVPRPLSPYAVSKLAGEYYCRVWSHLGRLSTVSLRYFNVFGPGQHPESKYSAVFPAFVAALTERRVPEIHWDGEQSRDFTYIDDVVAANLAAAAAGPDADGEVFNVGGGRTRSVNEVFDSVCEVLGYRIEPCRTPMRPGDVRCSRADISKAAGLLGWRPRADWAQSVKATVAWFLDRKV